MLMYPTTTACYTFCCSKHCFNNRKKSILTLPGKISPSLQRLSTAAQLDPQSLILETRPRRNKAGTEKNAQMELKQRKMEKLL